MALGEVLLELLVTNSGIRTNLLFLVDLERNNEQEDRDGPGVAILSLLDCVV